MRCDYARDDGAYVLGALSPTERAAFERHLTGCKSCRGAVAELAALPGLLARLDPATAEQVALKSDTAEPSRLPRLLHAAEQAHRRDRRRRRWTVTAAGLAAACLAALAGLGMALVDRPVGAPVGPPSDVPVAMASMVPTSAAWTGAVTAEVGLTAVAGGTRVRMHCAYADGAAYRKPYTFRLVAYGMDGETEQVASWKAGPGEDVVVTGMTRFTSDELDRLELQRGDGTALLVYTVT